MKTKTKGKKFTIPTFPAKSGAMSGAMLILCERVRQKRQEGWTAKHDDTHRDGELAKAAASYLATVATPDEWAEDHHIPPGPTDDWPWAPKWWKPSSDPIRNLVKAGALIAAEIDRLQRKGVRSVKDYIREDSQEDRA